MLGYVTNNILIRIYAKLYMHIIYAHTVQFEGNLQDKICVFSTLSMCSDHILLNKLWLYSRKSVP